MLAALGEATERALIGPLVASTSFHNPAMIAKKAATVDDISGGRLVLGLGAGWNEPEYAAFGLPSTIASHDSKRRSRSSELSFGRAPSITTAASTPIGR